MGRREMIQLCCLLLVVPMQYWLSNESQPTPFKSNIVDLVNRFQKVFTQLLVSPQLAKLWAAIVNTLDTGDLEGESPAKEVFAFRKQQDSFFAASDEPRYDRRIKSVLFRVGDTVRHAKLGYRAVVVGWDYTAQAPADYLDQVYSKNPEWIEQPNYLLAVDTRDRLIPQFTYIPEENLIRMEAGALVIHPNMDHYFERYDPLTSRYIARPWLKEIYPRD